MPESLIDTNLYIACLNLTGRPCLVVGGGPVALEKIEGLLACEAAVQVVAPNVIDEVRELEASGEIALRQAPYQTSDLNGCFLVIAATSDTELNTRVYEDAERRSMLVNVVDVPRLCNFILPAIVRRGPISVAISTSGASPALAKRLKREIAANYGEPYARLALMLNDVREWAKRELATYQDRKLFFEAIVNGEPDPIALLEHGDEDAVRAVIARAQQAATNGRRAPVSR